MACSGSYSVRSLWLASDSLSTLGDDVMKKDDLLTMGLLGLGGFLVLKYFGGGGLQPRGQLVAAAPNQIGALRPRGFVSEQKSAVEVRNLPVPSVQLPYDPYTHEDYSPTLGQRIETVGDAAERSLTVIHNVFTGLTDLFGGSSGADKAPSAVQTSSVSFLDVPPGDVVVV